MKLIVMAARGMRIISNICASIENSDILDSCK